MSKNNRFSIQAMRGLEEIGCELTDGGCKRAIFLLLKSDIAQMEQSSEGQLAEIQNASVLQGSLCPKPAVPGAGAGLWQRAPPDVRSEQIQYGKGSENG